MKFFKYFFFSDMHGQDGTFRDDFSQSFSVDMKFIERMELIKKIVDKIFGVGDIWDFWPTTHRKIMNAHFIVLKWIEKNVKLLAGNHDYSMFAPQTMKFITKSGKRVLVSHGFQNNKHMTRWYTRGFISIISNLERWIPWLDNPEKWPRLYKLLPKKYRKLYEKKMHEVTGIEKDVENYCRSFIGKYDIIICGHSHVQGSKILTEQNGSTDSILMLNCGHCTNGAFQGVLFDANTDKHEFV